MSDSNDLTFKPRIYSDNDFIFQSEYREAFENSNLISDFSFNRDEDNTNSHLFAKIDGKFDDKLKYELNIENVTNDNYLKIHDLKNNTPLINDDSTLTSSFKIDNEIDTRCWLKTAIENAKNTRNRKFGANSLSPMHSVLD